MKKLLAIVVLGLLWSGNANADNTFSVECTTKAKEVFNPNRKDVSDGKFISPLIFTFDEKKEKLIEINFQTEKDAPIFLSESNISWNDIMFSDDRRKAHMAKNFNMKDADSSIHAFNINRYTGEFEYSIYDLNEFWTNKYLGIKSKEDFKNFDVDTIFTKKFLIRSTNVLNKGIQETSKNIPQKDIIHGSTFTGDCKKKERKKKF